MGHGYELRFVPYPAHRTATVERFSPALLAHAIAAQTHAAPKLWQEPKLPDINYIYPYIKQIMDRWTINVMHQFTPDALAEIYLEQFKYEYGEKKLREVIQKIEDSEKVSNYISAMLHRNLNPTAKEVEVLMNSIPYFMFSKEETLCLGGLATIIIWKNKWIIHNDFPDEEALKVLESKVTVLCATLISNCSQNKYNKAENFFLRFFGISWTS